MRNFLFSPPSFHAAVALVAAGARGDTQRELLRFLGSPSLADLQRTATAATELVGRLGGLTRTCGVRVDRSCPLTQEFMVAAASSGCGIAATEFVDFLDAEQARRRANAFVASATDNLIHDVLPAGSVNLTTAVALVDALLFKGTWSQRFDPSATFTARFHLTDGTTVCTPFMTATSLSQQHVAVFPRFRTLKLLYYCNNNDDDVQQASAFYMLLFLPDNTTVGIKLADLYDNIIFTPEFVKNHTPAAKVPVGQFMVPKFKFTFEFEASSDMRKMGVSRAFRGADLSGMVTNGDGLSISGAYHKATIEVDELGNAAAATTGMPIDQGGSTRPPVDFVADRPFLFAIAEEITGAVLFLGHVVNPLAK